MTGIISDCASDIAALKARRAWSCITSRCSRSSSPNLATSNSGSFDALSMKDIKAPLATAGMFSLMSSNLDCKVGRPVCHFRPLDRLAGFQRGGDGGLVGRLGDADVFPVQRGFVRNNNGPLPVADRGREVWALKPAEIQCGECGKCRTTKGFRPALVSARALGRVVGNILRRLGAAGGLDGRADHVVDHIHGVAALALQHAGE